MISVLVPVFRLPLEWFSQCLASIEYDLARLEAALPDQPCSRDCYRVRRVRPDRYVELPPGAIKNSHVSASFTRRTTSEYRPHSILESRLAATNGLPALTRTTSPCPAASWRNGS